MDATSNTSLMKPTPRDSGVQLLSAKGKGSDPSPGPGESFRVVQLDMLDMLDDVADTVTVNVDHTADILCLRELNRYDQLMEYLGQDTFSGHFFPKPDSDSVDGTAVIYRTELFAELSTTTVTFTGWSRTPYPVFLQVELKHKSSGAVVSVITTHFKIKNDDEFEKKKLKEVQKWIATMNDTRTPRGLNPHTRLEGLDREGLDREGLNRPQRIWISCCD